MKITEFEQVLTIALNNEEAALLERAEPVQPLSSFNEREREVVKNLVRKSCLSKVVVDNIVMVVKNESGHN